MTQIIQFKRSTVTAIPTNLAPGEAAISEVGGGSLFFGKEDGTIIEIANLAALAKLAGIEAGATGDMTAAEVLAALNENENVNVLTDQLLTKLASIEAGATGDMTTAEVLAALLANENVNILTDDQLAKVNSLESSHFKGTFTSLAQLEDISSVEFSIGDYAHVDQGVGEEVVSYIWDNDDRKWVPQASKSNAETSASIKEKYESNPDTNNFRDADKAKLGGIEAGATGDMNGAEIVAAATAEDNFNAFTDADKAKLNSLDNNIDGGTF